MLFLAAPFLLLRHRGWRALGVVVLLGLIGLAAVPPALLLWMEYHLRAARAAVERGHNGPAIRHLRACRSLRPDHPEVLLLSARTARRGGAWTEAEALLDRYWQLRGDDEDLVLERLLLRATRGEVEAVGPLLQARIARGDPSSPLAREALAAGMMYRYRQRDADALINRWLEQEPDSTLALLARGKLQEQREQTSEALLTYRRLLELDPEHDEARLRMTRNLLLLSQGEEALTHLEYLRRRLPDNAEVLVQLAGALDLQGRADEARAALDECLRHHPDHAAALAERGRILLRDGERERAEDDLRRAVQLDPGNGAARYQYHLALLRNGKKDEAAQQQEALHRVKADVQRINELLTVRLQVTPDDPAVYHEVAMIALRAGLPREALRWLQSALQVDPNHAPTHRALAAYYHETGNPILAARHRALARKLGAPSGEEKK